MSTLSTKLLLVDTSALVRLLRQDAEELGWDQLIAQGLVGICALTELELLVSARSMTERTMLRSRLERSYASVILPDRVFQRAGEVQELLTAKGKHRGPGPIDLLVAATAELTERTLLHYDHDFEAIAEATGQSVQWLAAPRAL